MTSTGSVSPCSPASVASSGSGPRAATNAMLVVEMIGKSVTGMASRNEKVRYSKEQLEANFECTAVPEISLSDYMVSPVFMKLKDSTAIWKAAFILIKRLYTAAPQMLTPLTAHRVVLCAYTIAMKMVSDRVLSNKLIARYGGVGLVNLNNMERHFLAVIEWRTVISSEEYAALDSVYSLPLASSSASKRLAAAVLFGR